jgi:16S rRNA (guanine527-N7)-methyltransferase
MPTTVSMKPKALARLVERYQLDDGQRWQLDAILGELEGNRDAPTAVADARAAVDVHLADSLVALGVTGLADATRIADIGSGAGFPGLALAVALQDAEVGLVESRRRKCEFLERARDAANVRNASVVCGRVEEWREGVLSNDVVVARALAPQPVVLEYAAPLLKLGGTLIDWRGRRDTAGETCARDAAGVLGLRLREIRHVEPYEGALNHHLHVYEKVAETPDHFPRRVGVARKRPLGC